MQIKSAGRLVDVPVQWFFADDLPVLPHRTPYGSLNWRGENELPPGGPGEKIGAPRVWANGANVDPFCCTEPPENGGAVLGGSAGYWQDQDQIAEGGLVLDGAGDWPQTSLGGLVLDGAGDWSSTYSGGGGLVLDGAGTFIEGFTTGGGGLVLDGAGTFIEGFTTGGGGLVLDGAGDWSITFDGLGGLVLDGSGDWPSILAAFGGLVLDGEGDFSGSTPSMFETGMILFFGNVTPPSGWLACDGSAVSRSTYSTLFGVIGTTFGPGDGSTTFNVPDCKGRLMGGTGTLSGGSNRALGATGGAETHTIATAEMPAHTHGLATTSINTLAGATPVVSGGGSAVQTSSVGGITAMNLMNPFMFLTAIIKT